MLYDIYKLIYQASREKKEHIYNHFDEILSVIQLEGNIKESAYVNNIKEARILNSKENVFREITARGLHDPETEEEMKKLVSLLEKFLGIDGDISLDNIGVFMKPMGFGARKITLRPCRLVGLVRHLEKLARRFKNSEDPDEKTEIKKEFNKILVEVKDRLARPRAGRRRGRNL